MEPRVIKLSDDVTIIRGDCLDVLPVECDNIVTDPPYSSGGQFRGDRVRSTVSKYVQTNSIYTFKYPFTGDNRDQRAFLLWCSMWMGVARNSVKSDGLILSFIDWRQLPTITDAMQLAGWIWRGIATWWKPGIRMQKGRFSLSAEYIVIGSNGEFPEGEKSPQNVFSFNPVNGEDKNHIAEKPVEVINWILGVTKKESIVLDPFMGSGTTGIACINTGRKFIGIEMDENYFNVARKRLERELSQPRFDFDKTEFKQDVKQEMLFE